MDNIPHKRKRWNTMGFIVFIVYLFIVFGLMHIGHKFKDEHYVIQNTIVGLGIALVTVAILNCCRIIYKKSSNKKEQ